ncbi:MAG: hypothetical protein HUU35_08420 [Armatimonadetes bacterium]|nr:hypothetical protein [Armatimonadota bacterium]
MIGWALLAAVAALWLLLRRKQADRWVAPAGLHAARNWFIRRPVPVHVLFAVADHFEPSRGGVDNEVAAARLQRWIERLPEVAASHCDADGRPPRHTWFYPYDEWRDGELAQLGALCYEGLGEVELHLHHDRDTAETLRAKLLAAGVDFASYGALLTAEATPRIAYGFVHGNWCLDNSRPDGRWCGVNEELRLLAETGCYADFTLPTPDRTQPRMVNTVYRATDGPRPHSHDWGRPLRVGQAVPGDLLLIPGPLGFNLRDWHHRFYPAIERGELAHPSPVTPARLDFWLRTGVGVRGRPEWVFVKLHAHGCQERDQDDLLGAARHRLHELLEQRCGSGRYALHYCTARELYNLAMAAEAGHGGDPNPWRDYLLPPPVNTVLRSATPVRTRALSATHGDLENLSAGEVAWDLRTGPLARLRGPVRRLRWAADEISIEADGPVERTDAAQPMKT